MTDPTLTLDQLLADFRGECPGISALVLENGAPLLSITYGYANLEEKQAATSTTNYRLASVSKQFTAMACMQLVAAGKLSLSDRLARFFPDAPAFWNEISISDLLCHRSGLLDYEELLPADQSEQVRDEDVLEIVRPHQQGYFAPGSSYRYSNTAYCLLALIVAKVSDQAFGDFLREQIFLPCGMARTLLNDQGRTQIDERAYGYSLIDGVWQRTDQSLTSATQGDGGIYSSVSDLAHWDSALRSGMLLPADLMQQVFAVYSDTNEAGVDYGLGWFLRREQPVVYHTGDSIGFRTTILRRSDRSLSAIVLINRSIAEPLQIADALLDSVLE